MARQSALPPSLPPRLLMRPVAAAYGACSPAYFDELVRKGIMPPPRRIGPRRVAWDIRELDAAIDALPKDGDEADGPETDATWDDVDAT